MSDESSAAIREKRGDWVTEHREMYLKSGGVQGHIMDVEPVGGFKFATHCMIKYTGRKSGRTLITPLCCGAYAGEWAIVASKGGADTHPAWYLNLIEMDEIEFQVATEAFRASWREPEGAEREKIWNYMADCFPFYNDYQKSTDRIIPIVMMQPIESIPVFKLEDADAWRDG